MREKKEERKKKIIEEKKRLKKPHPDKKAREVSEKNKMCIYTSELSFHDPRATEPFKGEKLIPVPNCSGMLCNDRLQNKKKKKKKKKSTFQGVKSD